MIITIDGAAGTGKSSTAKKLAETLKFQFIDTGAMYRSLTLAILQEGIDVDDDEKIAKILQNFSLAINIDAKGEKHYFVNDVDVTLTIRSQEVTSLVSKVSAKSAVREKMVSLQREFAKGKNCVCEGRDLGTVVFPKADLKVFLTASEEVRAERRYKEIIVQFPQIAPLGVKSILEDIKKRDLFDSTRALAPLKCPENALTIDTSHLTLDEVIAQIIGRGGSKIQKYFEKSFPKKRLFYRFISFLSLLYLKLFYRLEIYGLENFPKGRGVIAANHSSVLDPIVAGAVSPEELHFLAKASLFRLPLLASLIRRLNSHPVSPKKADLKTFKDIISILKQDHKILLFPEGTRSQTSSLGELMPGMSFLALQGNAPIIPFYIEGTGKLRKKNQKQPKILGKIRCAFGKPIYPNSFSSILDKKERESMLSSKTKESLEKLCSFLEAIK